MTSFPQPLSNPGDSYKLPLPTYFDNEPVKWLRPSEISKSPIFLSECGNDPFKRRNEVVKGYNGGFFLAAVAGLTGYPDRFDEVVPPWQRFNRYGEFVFIFFAKEGGNPTIVKIDDRLPTLHGQLIFARAPGDVFWCPLLEKAYAKFLGGYDKLNLGEISRSLLHLTGQQTVIVFTTFLLPSIIYSRISELIEKKQIVCCKHRHYDDNNLEYGGAYTVTGLRYSSSESYQIRIRDVKMKNGEEQWMTMTDFKKGYDVIFGTVVNERMERRMRRGTLNDERTLIDDYGRITVSVRGVKRGD